MWQPISTAPTDKPILAWCDHEADPYYKDKEGKHLTTYAAHSEGLNHFGTGYCIVEWGGGFDDRSYEEPNGANYHDWWFVVGSDFEFVANPTHWMPLPAPPTTE